MKVFTVTDDNINYIFGRVVKFFYNNHETGFESWHSFDCGFKKHIPRKILIDGKKVSTGIHYPKPLKISAYSRGRVTPGGNDILESIIINLTATDNDSIHIGDKIAFMGNRIILRQKWLFTKDNNWIYTVYQVKPMRHDAQIAMHEYAEMENKAFADFD